MISFTGGCVINLDDLEEFPDYFQVISKLITQIKQANVSFTSLKVLLDADLEDVQHIPQFRQLIHSLIQNYQRILNPERGESIVREVKAKFIVFLLKMAKNYFTSFSLEEEEAKPILTVLQKQLINYPDYFTDFFLAIATFAAYAQKHSEFIALYYQSVNEQKIFESEDLALSYIKSVDKILRFREFRKAFLENQNNKIPVFLNFKINTHLFGIGTSETQKSYVQFLESLPEAKSNFVSEYTQNLNKLLKL